MHLPVSEPRHFRPAEKRATALTSNTPYRQARRGALIGAPIGLAAGAALYGGIGYLLAGSVGLYAGIGVAIAFAAAGLIICLRFLRQLLDLEQAPAPTWLCQDRDYDDIPF